MNPSDISLDSITDQVLKEEGTPSFLENWEGPLLPEKSLGRNVFPRVVSLFFREFLVKGNAYIRCHKIPGLIAILGVVAIIGWVSAHWPHQGQTLPPNKVLPIVNPLAGLKTQPEGPVLRSALPQDGRTPPHSIEPTHDRINSAKDSGARSNPTRSVSAEIVPDRVHSSKDWEVIPQGQDKDSGPVNSAGMISPSHTEIEPVDQVVLQTNAGVVFPHPSSIKERSVTKTGPPSKAVSYKERKRQEKQRGWQQLRQIQGQKLLARQQPVARLSPPQPVIGQKIGQPVPPVTVEVKPLSATLEKADPDAASKCPLAVADRTIWLVEGQMFVRSDGLWVCQRVNGKLSAQKKNPR